LFSPILLEPSLTLLDVEVNGSGAAILESFDSHFVQTMAVVASGYFYRKVVLGDMDVLW